MISCSHALLLNFKSPIFMMYKLITKYFYQGAVGKSTYWVKVIGLLIVALVGWYYELKSVTPGILHFQGTSEFLYILDGRPLINKVFDPATLDWGFYRARELMYLLYITETYAIYYLGKLGFIGYFSVLHYFFLALILLALFSIRTSFIQSREYFYTNALLLFNFFLTPNILLGGLSLYRPGKIANVFGIILLALVISRVKEFRSHVNYIFIFMLSSMICLIDEIGYVSILVIFSLSGSYFVFRPSIKLAWLSVSLLFGILFHTLYNRIIGPSIISEVNRYDVNFTFQNTNLLHNINSEAFLNSIAIIVREVGAFYGGHNLYLGTVVLLTFILGLIWLDVKSFKRTHPELYFINYLNPAKYYSVSIFIVFAALIFTYTVLISNFPSITSSATYYMLPLSSAIFLINVVFINLLLKHFPRLNLSIIAVLLFSLGFNIYGAPDNTKKYISSDAVQPMKTQTESLANCVANQGRNIGSLNFRPSEQSSTYNYEKLCFFLLNKFAYDRNLPSQIRLSNNDQIHVNELVELRNALESYKAKYNEYPSTDGKWIALNSCNVYTRQLAQYLAPKKTNIGLQTKLGKCALEYTYKSNGSSYKLIYDAPSDCGLVTFKYPQLRDPMRSCTEDSTVNLCYPSSAGYLAENKCWAYGESAEDGNNW